jgi:3',5'-cyclic AMP phosphodiesterase CpdA
LDPAPDIVIHTGDLTDNGVLLDYELAVERLAKSNRKVLTHTARRDMAGLEQFSPG